MKTFALVALFVAGVSSSTIRIGSLEPVATFRAAPLALVREIPIIRFSQDIRGAQESNLQYETGNGISVSDNTLARKALGGLYEDESGKMVPSEFLIQKTGSYSYTSPEGQVINTQWVADENGFRVEGAHLPKSVELPAEHAEAHRLALAKVSAVSSYDAPLIRSSSYDAPAVRVIDSSPLLVRSGY
ncbi:Larval cuticle protein LCP-17 [Orchesella cincta]|uniref:Larval cuticle protein LCP-17 n=1 Tax=Orchesella cincta TaxID=48709 RepID=A0A1D2MVW9_ORCCI|nr:Larval cuticle protein LCP-17 [Orchesella cincta]